MSPTRHRPNQNARGNPVPIIPWAISTTTAPYDIPVSVAECKKHLEIPESVDDHDAQLMALIAAAVECVEYDTRTRLVQQTVELSMDGFPYGASYFDLPGPVSSVTSVKYLDSGGAEQTWSSVEYSVDSKRDIIYLAYNATWPTTQVIPNAVTVTYVAGNTIGNVPQMAKHAVRLLVAHAFENREPILIGTISKEVEQAYGSLVHRLRPGGYP